MAISESHSHTTGQSAKVTTDAGVSAIQRQKALEAAYAKNQPSQPPGPQRQAVNSGSRKFGWLLLIGLLLLLTLALLRYPDMLSQLAGKLAPVDSSLQPDVLLQQQLATARDLDESLLGKPDSLGLLVSLYRTVLQQYPNQAQALSGLEGLPEKCISLLSFYVATAQWDIARQFADDSLGYFPRLAADPRWQQLLNNIPSPVLQQSPKIEVAASTGKESIGDSKVTSPQLMDGANEEIIVDAPTEQPGSQTEATETLLPDTQVGLINASRTDQLPPAADSVETGLEEKIQRLLSEARDFSRQGVKFTQQENAVTRYQDVLALEPNQPEASEELRSLIDARASYVENLWADGDPGTARIFLEQALEYFPADTRLLHLSRQIAEGGGAISQVTIDFMPEKQVDTGFAAAGGKVLLLSFNYKYFPVTTTVVNARLFTYPGLEAIADVPILIQEQRGSKSIQLSTMDRNVLDGRYQLTLSVANKNLIKHEFSVKDGRIINDQP